MDRQVTTRGGREKSSEDLRRQRRRLPRAQRHELNTKKSIERKTSESNIRNGSKKNSDEFYEKRPAKSSDVKQSSEKSSESSSLPKHKTSGSVPVIFSSLVRPAAFSTTTRVHHEIQLTAGKRENISTAPYVGMFKAKILVIGPRECGKTVISNYLADATEISGGDYHPTQGVRILEFESTGIPVGDKEVSCEVELWDCSGDQKFENCWPAIQKDANGVLFVYNPDNVSHGKELETLTLQKCYKKNLFLNLARYVHFVQEQGLRDSQCMLFAHHKPGANEKTRSHIPSYLSKIPCVQTNLEDDSETVKEKFNDLLAVLLRNWTDRRDQEELSIMNN